MAKKTSIIWTVSHETLQNLFDNCHSVCEILRRLGLPTKSGNHRTLTKRLGEEDFDLTQFQINKKLELKSRPNNAHKSIKIPNEKVFCEGSSYSCNIQLKKRLVNDYGWTYQCSECGVGDSYNDKPLTLQLDHINGDNTDHRLQNLQFLCPNCHSQTNNFSGRNIKKQAAKFFCKCGGERNRGAVICLECHKKQKLESSKIPPKEILEKEVWESPSVQLSKRYGVSDKTIGNWCKKHQIEKPTRGYWRKPENINWEKNGAGSQ